MKDAQLTLSDMIRGLERFGDRYEALDVFADDIRELSDRMRIEGLIQLDDEGRQFALSKDGKRYGLEFFPDSGIVRLSRSPPMTTGNDVAGGMIVGGLVGAAIGRASTAKGNGAGMGLVLGMLVGALMGEAKSQKRVFTLRFDPTSRQWYGYDGGLVRWMKQQVPNL